MLARPLDGSNTVLLVVEHACGQSSKNGGKLVIISSNPTHTSILTKTRLLVFPRSPHLSTSACLFSWFRQQACFSDVISSPETPQQFYFHCYLILLSSALSRWLHYLWPSACSCEHKTSRSAHRLTLETPLNAIKESRSHLASFGSCSFVIKASECGRGDTSYVNVHSQLSDIKPKTKRGGARAHFK